MINSIWYFDKKNVYVTFYQDLYEDVIFKKDILIECTFPIDFKVKLKVR
jgi:hypothetical protein